MKKLSPLFWKHIKKHLLIISCLLLVFPFLYWEMSTVPVHSYDSLLLTISILIIAVLFADYAFSFAETDRKNAVQNFLAFWTTFIIIFCTGVMLQAASIIITFQVGHPVWSIIGVSILFYLSLVFYDLWDLLRRPSAN